MKKRRFVVLTLLAAGVGLCSAGPAFLADDLRMNPYDRQITEQLTRLESPDENVRAGAAESLGFMRACAAASALAQTLTHDTVKVRRQAALALAWCGSQPQVNALLGALDDEDWVVRQTAWVSLTNLTGMEMPFDAQAAPALRRAQADQWRRWWQAIAPETVPSDITTCLNSTDLKARLRAVRALGALGGTGASRAAIKVIAPYREADYQRLSPLEKDIVQSGLRSLGRLQAPEAWHTLLGFLDTVAWARYAADALGDYSDRRAVPILIKAYPRFSRNLQKRTRDPDLCPADDRFSGDNTQDRMHETPYAIAAALARLPLDHPADRAALRQMTPYILANLPTSWDSGVFYEIEAAQLLTAYLLEKAWMRAQVCDIAFAAAYQLGSEEDTVTGQERTPEEIIARLAIRMYGDVPDIATWFPAICRQGDVPRLLTLLEHDNGWIVINVVKALMFLGDKRAIEPTARLLIESKTEAQWGYSGVLEHAEYSDPAPRRREAYIRALGRLGAKQYDRLLATILSDSRNVVDIQHAAALALDELGTAHALEALKQAQQTHPIASVRLVAREAVWRRGLLESAKAESNTIPPAPSLLSKHTGPTPEPRAIVFIKGDKRMRTDFNGQAGVDPWRQTYTITNSGPAMRVGRNLYELRPARPDGQVTALTQFQNGLVADCEISWDGKRVIFARRLNGDTRNYRQVRYEKAQLKDPAKPLLGTEDDPWWHIWEMNVDGTGLRQLTFGPYHDVNPAYLPDGRIVFSSSRIGLRDEYHGYPCIGLSVMNANGSDIHPIGFNLGADRDPAILADGRIVFSRVDIIYSRLKTEVALHTVFPDGTRNESLYGPERRPFWRQVHKKNAAWWMRPSYNDEPDSRNRVLRLSQAQPMGDGRIVCASSAGLVITGPGRYRETLVPHERKYAVTSPFPVGKNRVLCSATVKQFKINEQVITCGEPAFETLEKGERLFRSAINIDLGIYWMDTNTGKMALLYNDPQQADFEARPIMARTPPPLLAENSATRAPAFTARLFCNSARVSRHARVTERGKLLRIIEGQPVVSRHETQQNRP